MQYDLNNFVDLLSQAIAICNRIESPETEIDEFEQMRIVIKQTITDIAKLKDTYRGLKLIIKVIENDIDKYFGKFVDSTIREKLNDLRRTYKEINDMLINHAVLFETWGINTDDLFEQASFCNSKRPDYEFSTKAFPFNPDEENKEIRIVRGYW